MHSRAQAHYMPPLVARHALQMPAQAHSRRLSPVGRPTPPTPPRCVQRRAHAACCPPSPPPAADDVEEIQGAVRAAIQQCCVQLKSKIAKQQAAREQRQRKKNLTKYIPNVAAALHTVLQALAARREQAPAGKGGGGRQRRGRGPAVVPGPPGAADVAAGALARPLSLRGRALAQPAYPSLAANSCARRARAAPRCRSQPVAGQGQLARAAHPWPASSTHAHESTLSFFLSSSQAAAAGCGRTACGGGGAERGGDRGQAGGQAERACGADRCRHGAQPACCSDE